MGLQDFTEYAIAIQCKGALAKFWSEWSEERIGRTEEKGRRIIYIISFFPGFNWGYFWSRFNNSNLFLFSAYLSIC